MERSTEGWKNDENRLSDSAFLQDTKVDAEIDTGLFIALLVERDGS